MAVALTVLRARAYPSQRRPIGWAVALLAVGGLIGTLSGAGGPLCDPQSLWHGHAAWHVLAATALVVLAPVVGWGRAGRDDRRPARGTGRTSGPRPGGTHTSVAQKLTASSGDLAEPDPELLITKSRRRSALSRPSACYR